MKRCTYEDLRVGKIYDTVRKRSFERVLYSQPEMSDRIVSGDCTPEDNFVVLELLYDGKSKWTKVLTSKGIIGWTIWIESLDPNPAFIELTPESIEIPNVTKENP